jgi:hypothetical protein
MRSFEWMRGVVLERHLGHAMVARGPIFLALATVIALDGERVEVAQLLATLAALLEVGADGSREDVTVETLNIEALGRRRSH